MASIRRRPDRPSPWEAVFRDPSGRQQTQAFRRKVDAQRWLDEQTAAIVTGQYLSPEAMRVTVRVYGERWRAMQVHRPSSADKIESLLRLHVYPVLGDRRMTTVRPSDIQAWVKRLMVEHRLAPARVARRPWRPGFDLQVRSTGRDRARLPVPGHPLAREPSPAGGALGARAGARPGGRDAGALACDGAAGRGSRSTGVRGPWAHGGPNRPQAALGEAHAADRPAARAAHGREPA